MTKHYLLTGLAVFVLTGATVVLYQTYGASGRPLSYSNTEFLEETDESITNTWNPYANWKRPDGPLRVGVQAGHWMAAEAPDEQERLRVNTGASGGGTTEWETNVAIAESIRAKLLPFGIEVDVLPTTIPPAYLADAFISIHADGNVDTSVRGYKVAPPRRDMSGHAMTLADLIENTYATATDLPLDPSISRAMRGYYAFNWRRYDHAIHPMTPAAIIETGFLTNSRDRATIVSKPEVSAEGIANGILQFLRERYPEKFTEDSTAKPAE